MASANATVEATAAAASATEPAHAAVGPFETFLTSLVIARNATPSSSSSSTTAPTTPPTPSSSSPSSTSPTSSSTPGTTSMSPPSVTSMPLQHQKQATSSSSPSSAAPTTPTAINGSGGAAAAVVPSAGAHGAGSTSPLSASSPMSSPTLSFSLSSSPLLPSSSALPAAVPALVACVAAAVEAKTAAAAATSGTASSGGAAPAAANLSTSPTAAVPKSENGSQARAKATNSGTAPYRGPTTVNAGTVHSTGQSGSAGGTTANGGSGTGSGSTALQFDVTTTGGREALLLRFLQLLPSPVDLQQPRNAGEADTTTKGCQQLLNDVVVALRLWVIQQPLSLGRPLGEDNPSLFALLQPQLSRLHWWRSPNHTALSSLPTVAGSTPSSSPSSPVGDDLLALAWGNRAWQPPVPTAGSPVSAKREHTEVTSPNSPPPATVLPTIKIENAGTVTPSPTFVNNGGASASVSSPSQSSAPVGGNAGFEFNENGSESLLPATVLNKRRRSVGSLESSSMLMARQPAKDQALRKRRKSVIERTTTTTVIMRQEETESVAVVGRELRKRKNSISGPLTTTDQPLATLDSSPKRFKYEDEDYVDQGVDKEKEAHGESSGSTTPGRSSRGRGRGRGTRASRGGRGGRGGRAHRDRDLETTPKTKARKPESCHRCKNKKEFWVGCPLVASHKYCRGCVVRHFAIDYDDFRANPEKYWSDGCPICHLTCPCIGCVRKKQGQQDLDNDDDKIDVERDDDDVGDPDEDEDEEEDVDDGYGSYDENGEELAEEDDAPVDIESDLSSIEEKSAESLIEVKWTALKRQLNLKDASAAAAADAINSLSPETSSQHLPVKKRMSRMRSNSIATTHLNGHSSSSAQSISGLDDSFTPQTTFQIQPQQPPRKRAPRLRSYSTSYCSDPKPSAAMNPEDYLGRTGAGSVLAARYTSPQRRGSRGHNSRGAYN